MTTEAELVAAIAANLDDDAPRQVYADWLSERGDPRGELIQLQVALVGMAEDDERRKKTESRVAAILAEHGDVWLGRLRELRRHGIHFSFDRGVIGALLGTPSVLAKQGEGIAGAAKLLAQVTIRIDRDDRELAGLAGSPLLACIRDLRIAGAQPQRVTGWEALQLPQLRALTLSALALGPEDLDAVVAAPRAAMLSTLSISMCRLNSGVVESLSRLGCPLRRLVLPAAHFGPRLGEIAGANSSFHGLVELSIAGNELGRAGLEQVRPALRHAEILDLRGNALAVDDLPLLLDPAVIPAVRVLELGGNPLGDKGAAAIAAFAGAAQLTRLHLGDAGVTAAGARLLAGSASLAKLRSLVLTGRRFDPETEAILVASPHLANARIYGGDRFLSRSPPKPKRPARKPPP